MLWKLSMEKMEFYSKPCVFLEHLKIKATLFYFFRTVKPGSQLFDSSTIDPDVAKELFTLSDKKGCLFMDAPVSGGIFLSSTMKLQISNFFLSRLFGGCCWNLDIYGRLRSKGIWESQRVFSWHGQKYCPLRWSRKWSCCQTLQQYALRHNHGWHCWSFELGNKVTSKSNFWFWVSIFGFEFNFFTCFLILLIFMLL